MSLTDIYIRDKDYDIIRKVGDDAHDQLTINKDGQLQYYNLQNGCGCRTGEPSETYEFVPNEDPWGYNIDPREEAQPMTHDIIWTVILAVSVGIGMAILCR